MYYILNLANIHNLFFKSILQMLIFDLVILSTSCIILDMILLWTELHASGGGLVGQRTP